MNTKLDNKPDNKPDNKLDHQFDLPPVVLSGQLSLGLETPKAITLDNFNSDNNKTTLTIINKLLKTSKQIKSDFDTEKSLYLYGPSGCGKTHLLKAIAHQATKLKLSSIYLDLNQIIDSDPSLLEEAKHLEVICLDNIELICGNKQWELACFNLFNRVYTHGTSLVVSSNTKPKALAINLADLLSRLQWVLALKINSLDTDSLKPIIIERFANKGLYISDEVLKFTLCRLERNVKDIFHKIDLIINTAICESRQITIPFIKKVINI